MYTFLARVLRCALPSPLSFPYPCMCVHMSRPGQLNSPKILHMLLNYRSHHCKRFSRERRRTSLSLILSHLLRTHMRMHMCLGESCVQSGLTDQLCLYDLRLFPALCVDHLMYTAPPMRLAGTRCLRLRPVPSESSDWCSPSMPSSLPPLCIALSQHFPVDIIDSYVYIHTYIDSYLRVHIDAFTHTHTHTYDVTITCTQTPRRDMYQ